MGCITVLGRCIVTLLNTIFLILGLALIAAGVIAYKASDISFLKDIETAIKNGLKAIASSAGVTNNSVSNFSISEILGGLAMGFIIAGCILSVLSFLGCCGACCKFKTLVCLYGFIVTVLLVGEIIVVILMFAPPKIIQGVIKGVLLESVKQYKGISGTDVVTLSWMFVMQEMKCCGVNGYADFNWSNQAEGSYTGFVAPVVCCKTVSATCGKLASLNIYEQGCYDAVWNTVLGNPIWAGIGFGAGFTFQVLLIIVSILLYIYMRNEKNGKVYPDK